MSQATLSQPDDKRNVRQLMWFIGVGYLFYILADPRDGVAKLAIKYALKDQLHMSADAMASFAFAVNFAWYLKPLAGVITDTVSLLGTRRKAYILVSTGLAALMYIVLAVVPTSYGAMFVSLLSLNVALVFAQTTVGGVMVEAGQRFNATGRLSSVRNAAESFGVCVASVIAGVLAAKFLVGAYLLSALLLIAMVALAMILLRETKAESTGYGQLQARLGDFKTLFSSRALWAASFFWMLVRFSPGFQTPLFVHQSETLKFTPEFIGTLGSIQAGANIIASIFYVWACRRFQLKYLVYVGIAVNVIASACYLGYTSESAARVIEALYGLGSGLAFMPFLDLVARSTPKKFEAMGYALIFSFGNLSLFGSDLIGSKIYEATHRNFTGMVWMNTITSMIVLVAVPLLPRVLMAAKDGEAHVGDVANIKETGEPD